MTRKFNCFWRTFRSSLCFAQCCQRAVIVGLNCPSSPRPAVSGKSKRPSGQGLRTILHRSESLQNPSSVNGFCCACSAVGRWRCCKLSSSSTVNGGPRRTNPHLTSSTPPLATWCSPAATQRPRTSALRVRRLLPPSTRSRKPRQRCQLRFDADRALSCGHGSQRSYGVCQYGIPPCKFTAVQDQLIRIV